jgi:REP element-mobilizing transposase RayT
MSVHTVIKRRGVYFITFTCFQWHPLIELSNGYDLLYKFFDFMKSNDNYILGFVIMPNHVHLLLHYTNVSQSLNTVIGNGKRFIGYEIVKRLKNNGEDGIINKMKEAVSVNDRKKNKKHQIWEGSFEAKECRTEKFLLQKLIYIHNNPCSGKWNLCEKPHQYAHSSAGFYDGFKSGYIVKDYFDVLSELQFGCE